MCVYMCVYLILGHFLFKKALLKLAAMKCRSMYVVKVIVSTRRPQNVIHILQAGKCPINIVDTLPQCINLDEGPCVLKLGQCWCFIVGEKEYQMHLYQ